MKKTRSRENKKHLNDNSAFWAVDSRVHILSDRDEREIERISQITEHLDDDKFSSLLENIDSEQKNTYQKLFLGRFVWDRFYQGIQQVLELKNKGYGRVLLC